jgi:hypothetical protein
MVPVEKVVAFAAAVPALVTKVLVCVGIDDASSAAYLSQLRAATAGDTRVVIQHVQPWGQFVHALNVGVGYAKLHSHDVLQFMSLEMRLTEEAVATILSRLGPDVLVAGVALPGHAYQPNTGGPLPITGRTCPWNTAAAWDVAKLGHTGFPLVGDGDAPSGLAGGVEEVSAISLQQLVNPSDCKAVLCRVPGMQWDTTFDDPERREWHERKMVSKDERPRLQMDDMGLSPGYVWHV